MKRTDLCQRLQREYRDGVSCGVVHPHSDQYRHLWFVVPPPPPQTLTYSLDVDKLTAANQALDKLPCHGQEDEIDTLLSYLFVRHEATVSSRLEGTWSTLDEVLTPHDAVNIARSETASVRAYAKALDLHVATIKERGYSTLNHELVCKLHASVVARDPNFHGRPGHYRAPGDPGAIVHIGGLGRIEDSTYNPPPPELVRHCIDQVMDWFQDDVLADMGDAGIGGLPLLARLAVGHAHFEAVHPFSDGNGRVGRMLWPLQMVLAGKLPLYLSGFVEAKRRDYLQALIAAQQQLDYNPLVAFICDAVVASAHQATATRRALLSLPDAWRQRSHYRANSTAARALDLLLQLPILDVKVLAQRLDVSRQAANLAVKQLCDDHILRERTGQRRNRSFAAEEIISLLTRQLGEDTEIALAHARRLLQQ